MVRYSEDPAVQVEAHISAPPAVVWPLISDITLPPARRPVRAPVRLAGRQPGDRVQANTTGISGEVKRRFLPGPKAGASTPRSR